MTAAKKRPPRRPLDDVELKRLEAAISYVIANPHPFSVFEIDFADSMADRVEQYAHRAFVTPLQWEAVERIEKKITKEETQPVGRSPEGGG